MPLPSSPDPIKASEIKNEFGTNDSPKIRIGQYRDATTHGGKQWPFDVGIPIGTGSDDTTTSIRFSDFHGKQLNTITVIDGGNTETRIIASEEDKKVIGGLKSSTVKSVRARARNIIYVVNKTIGSDPGSRSTCALRTGDSNAWYGTNKQESPKINIELGEGAKLYGAGGEGGKGGNADGGSGENGENGTSALGLEVPTESIVVRSGAKIVAGGGGGGGGGGAKNSKAKVSGGAGGGGAGLPGANGGSAGNTSAAGSILTFEMRSSAAFVNQSTRELTPTGEGGGTQESDTGGWFAGDVNSDGLTVSGTAYRSGEGGNAPPFAWTSLEDPPVVETVNMIGGNGEGFRATIRYSPHQKAADSGTSRFQTKIQIDAVLNRGQKYNDGNVLSTTRWNSGEGNAQRIIKVTSVSTRTQGDDADGGNLEEGGDGGDGDSIDTGDGGGVASGGGGGGGSAISGQGGSGGIRGIKDQDTAQNGQGGSGERGGDGGAGTAEGGDQSFGSGGEGGANGYAITSSVGSIPAVSGTSRVYGDQASNGGVS